MISNEDFQKFSDKYLKPRELPMKSPNKEKAVLYLQFPSPSSKVDIYSVKSMNLSNNTLTVNLKKSPAALVEGGIGFKGTWKWIILIEVDKDNLKNNMKIVINK